MNHTTDQLLDTLTTMRPPLRAIRESAHLMDYLAPALEWNPDPQVFPERSLVEEVLHQELQRVHGAETAALTSKELSTNFVCASGAHLHLPRIKDRMEAPLDSHMNPLVSQSEILWASVLRKQDRRVAFSIATGRVNPNNVNSAKYIQFPSGAAITLASNKYKDTPQVFIPALDQNMLNEKHKELTRLQKEQHISDTEFEMARSILHRMAQSESSSFADQIALAHSHFLTDTMSGHIQQVTLEAEEVGKQILIAGLSQDTVLKRLFDHHSDTLVTQLSDIDTGWKTGETPFFSVIPNSKGLHKFAPYTGPLNSTHILQGLQDGTLYPRVLTGFLASVVSGGLLPVGGMNQSLYLDEMRTRLLPLLREMGEGARADALEAMPLDLMTLSPCWGVREEEDQVELLSLPILHTRRRLTSTDMDQICALSGTDALTLALPALYPYCTNGEETPPLSELIAHIRDSIFILQTS